MTYNYLSEMYYRIQFTTATGKERATERVRKRERKREIREVGRS